MSELTGLSIVILLAVIVWQLYKLREKLDKS